MPAHTFVATCSAVVNVGATPVLVDVADDFNIDVTKIEAAITGRAPAIIPVYRHEALKLEDRSFPVTEAISREVCFLPMNVEMGDDEVDYVIQVARSFCGK